MKKETARISLIVFLAAYLVYGFFTMEPPSYSPSEEVLSGQATALMLVSGQKSLSDLSSSELENLQSALNDPGSQTIIFSKPSDSVQQAQPVKRGVDTCTVNGEVRIGSIVYNPKKACKLACIACALGQPSCDNPISQQWYREHILWCLNPLNSILLP